MLSKGKTPPVYFAEEHKNNLTGEVDKDSNLV
jgi:hypothetical protein